MVRHASRSDPVLLELRPQCPLADSQQRRGLGLVVARGRQRVQDRASLRLGRVMNGKRMVAAGEPGDMKKTWVYPTLAQRVQVAETLLKKLLPDLRATELTGKDGAPLIEPTRHDELYSTMEIARRIAFVLASGAEAKRELAEMDAPTIDRSVQDMCLTS